MNADLLSSVFFLADTTIADLFKLAIVGVLSPVVLLILTNRGRRAEKRMEWDRQDAVAAQAKKDAETASEQAKEAARLLAESNVLIKKTAECTELKLDGLKEGQGHLASGQKQIHTLVNSNMTAEMQRGLVALEGQAVMMEHVAELKGKLGLEVTAESKVALETVRRQIAELRSTLADRAKQTDIANELAAADIHEKKGA